jgi:hypothetical protein
MYICYLLRKREEYSNAWNIEICDTNRTIRRDIAPVVENDVKHQRIKDNRTIFEITNMQHFTLVLFIPLEPLVY